MFKKLFAIKRFAGMVTYLDQINKNPMCFQSPLQYHFRLLHNNLVHCQRIKKNTYLIDENNSIDYYVNSHTGCNKFTDRTHNCGELRIASVGQHVILCGWLEYQRMNKFIVIRDGYGHTQLLIDDKDVETQKLLKDLPYESIIKVKGTVLSRPKDMINSSQVTGDIEVLIESFQVLNEVEKQLPFNIREFQKAKESLRMQYRYLDLRFPQMQNFLRIRSKVIMAMRNFLVNECHFVEVETPTLFKATPGGAQEFIVPTRFPGQFYSLVQSPQQFKQMLMAGAIDRYFQVARCYRDEGSRSDRQPEFTQLDIEMSFTNIEGVIRLIEELLQFSWPDFLPPLPYSFPKMTYKDAMEQYGTDKPDTRYEFKIQNCRSAFEEENTAISDDFGAYGMVFNDPFIGLSKSVKHSLNNLAEKYSEAKFIASKVIDVDDWSSKISRLFGERITQKCIEILRFKGNCVVFLAYGNADQVLSLLGKVRLEYINVLEQNGHEIKKEGMHPLWIIDFPLFEKNAAKGNLQSAHHPFTAPHLDDLKLLESCPIKVRAQAYDLVLNGNEIGGGSVRIHNPVQQGLILDILNIERKFVQHMIDMLGSGCPPHGGIAIGLDRLLAIILETPSIRDVIAFPKSYDGRDLLSGAPSSVSDDVKKLYHL